MSISNSATQNQTDSQLCNSNILSAKWEATEAQQSCIITCYPLPSSAAQSLCRTVFWIPQAEKCPGRLEETGWNWCRVAIRGQESLQSQLPEDARMPCCFISLTSSWAFTNISLTWAQNAANDFPTNTNMPHIFSQWRESSSTVTYQDNNLRFANGFRSFWNFCFTTGLFDLQNPTKLILSNIHAATHYTVQWAFEWWPETTSGRMIKLIQNKIPISRTKI